MNDGCTCFGDVVILVIAVFIELLLYIEKQKYDLIECNS